jgi:nitrogen PTS system EIIA component
MVDLTHILERRCTLAKAKAQSRKRALEIASDLIAAGEDSVSARTLFDSLMSRERLGSTGLGEGVAIPHCRLPCERMLAAFLSLERPVDFEAADAEPVDLLFVLVVPPEETSAHLEALAVLARLFQEPEHRRRLRRQETSDALYEELTGLLRDQAA